MGNEASRAERIKARAEAKAASRERRAKARSRYACYYSTGEGSEAGRPSTRIDGIGNVAAGVYDELSVDGICTVEGDLEARSMDVNGITTIKGTVTAGSFDCDGVVTIEGCLRASTAAIDGVVTVNGANVDADEVRCDGVLTVEGVLSADKVSADGFINAHEIVGDDIRIESARKSWVFRAFSKVKDAITGQDFSSVNLIEATSVKLTGMRAKEVNGHNVTIGKYCIIGRLSCTGKLEVHPTAEVQEYVGAPKAADVPTEEASPEQAVADKE